MLSVSLKTIPILQRLCRTDCSLYVTCEQFALLAAFTPIARTNYRDLVSFNPDEEAMKNGASVRFGGQADTFVFSHIAVTPTPGWGDITAVNYA